MGIFGKSKDKDEIPNEISDEELNAYMNMSVEEIEALHIKDMKAYGVDLEEESQQLLNELNKYVEKIAENDPEWVVETKNVYHYYDNSYANSKIYFTRPDNIMVSLFIKQVENDKPHTPGMIYWHPIAGIKISQLDEGGNCKFDIFFKEYDKHVPRKACFVRIEEYVERTKSEILEMEISQKKIILNESTNRFWNS